MTREEAINVVRNIYQTDKEKEALGVLVPELRESEDEKIRTLLVALVQWAKTFNQGGLDPDTVNKMLTYLEKQKEQNEGLVYRLNGLMQDYIKEGKDEDEKEHRFKCYKLFWDALEDTNFFEQKEQKPNYCHHEVDETGWTEEYRKAYYDGWNNCNMQHEQLKADQKPAEWSDDDEQYLLICKNALNKYQRSDQWDANIISNWLEKRLKSSLRPQPKQELSKKDKKNTSISSPCYELC